jgi:hypothetical protein
MFETLIGQIGTPVLNPARLFFAVFVWLAFFVTLIFGAWHSVEMLLVVFRGSRSSQWKYSVLMGLVLVAVNAWSFWMMSNGIGRNIIVTELWLGYLIFTLSSLVCGTVVGFLRSPSAQENNPDVDREGRAGPI